MIKTAFILLITLVIVYFGLGFISSEFDIPRQDVFSWTGIVFLAFLFEKIIKYLLKLPFKHYFEELREHPLAKGVQDTGFTLSYIMVWLAVGATPINTAVAGVYPAHIISNFMFLKISIVLFFATLVFSILWWLSLKITK